jgi:centractin
VFDLCNSGNIFTCLSICIFLYLQKADCDLRKVLYSNIVLSGGTTLLAGFGDRLLGEVSCGAL